MEPERGPSNMVTLDTGTYQVGELMWLEFEVGNHGPATADAMDRWLARAAENAIKKSREDGKEFEYLGKQTKRVATLLEGCLVFAYPGDYQQISGAVV